MDVEGFFLELEDLINKSEGQKSESNLEAIIHYSTGEKDVFRVSALFMARALVSAKKRHKYLYVQKNLINLDHVVKIRFEELPASE